MTDRFIGGCPDDCAVQATSALTTGKPNFMLESRHGPGLSSLPALAQMDDLIQMTLPGPLRGRHCHTVGGGPRCPWHSLHAALPGCFVCLTCCRSSATLLQNLLRVGQPALWSRVWDREPCEGIPGNCSHRDWTSVWQKRAWSTRTGIP